MAGKWTSRQGLNVKGTESLTTGHADVNQNIYTRIAIARVLAEALGGEGILSGGASAIGDISAGTTYPAVTIILADDSGEFFYFQLTSGTAIDFASAGATSNLYAVIKLNTTDYASSYPAYGGYADVQLKAIDNGSAAPAHSLLLGSGSVTGSAFTTYTPNGAATSSGGLINFTLAGDTGTNQTIGRSDTLTIAGGTGIATAASATDTLTVTVVPGEIDHGAVTGLGDDDHTIYLKADGTRAASASLTLSGLTASRLVATDGSKVLASASLASWIAGTSNQVTVTDDLDGSITLSLPQSIATTSSPTFANITDSGLTMTRVPFASTGGLLADSASMVFDTTNGLTLEAGSASALNLTSTAGTSVGGLLFGADTNLYRSAADILQTDDAFHCSKAQINVADPGDFLIVSANLDNECGFQFTNSNTGSSAQAKYKWSVGTTGWQQIVNGSGVGGGNADQMWFYSNTLGDTVVKLLPSGNVYITGDCSALTFTDRTPFYQGDAVADIMAISGKDGEIDHSTLPDFARKEKVVDVFEEREVVENGKTLLQKEKVGEVVEQHRDLGAMISILVVAIQQLSNRLSELEDRREAVGG